MKYHSEIPDELEKEEMESVFNLNCFVTRAGADLKVSFSSRGGGKKRILYPYTQVSSVSFLYVNLNFQYMDANEKKFVIFILLRDLDSL